MFKTIKDFDILKLFLKILGNHNKLVATKKINFVSLKLYICHVSCIYF